MDVVPGSRVADRDLSNVPHASRLVVPQREWRRARQRVLWADPRPLTLTEPAQVSWIEASYWTGGPLAESRVTISYAGRVRNSSKRGASERRTKSSHASVNFPFPKRS